MPGQSDIYNSRNYSILLNSRRSRKDSESTTVEIILYYLTEFADCEGIESTTVEIILYYLTFRQLKPRLYLQQ